jgi:hypothetical protein
MVDTAIVVRFLHLLAPKPRCRMSSGIRWFNFRIEFECWMMSRVVSLHVIISHDHVLYSYDGRLPVVYINPIIRCATTDYYVPGVPPTSMHMHSWWLCILCTWYIVPGIHAVHTHLCIVSHTILYSVQYPYILHIDIVQVPVQCIVRILYHQSITVQKYYMTCQK